MTKENWLDVEGYEGVYKVSDLGRVYRLDSKKFLRPRKASKGYTAIALYKNAKREDIRLSRLVAKTFIRKPKEKEQVNHKNGVKDDNRLVNLEWCTGSENMLHSFRELGRKSTIGKLRYWKGKFGKNHHSSRKVVQLSLEGRFIKVWDALAQTENEGFYRGHVWSCCMGKSKTHHGYKWKYFNQ